MPSPTLCLWLPRGKLRQMRQWPALPNNHRKEFRIFLIRGKCQDPPSNHLLNGGALPGLHPYRDPSGRRLHPSLESHFLWPITTNMPIVPSLVCPFYPHISFAQGPEQGNSKSIHLVHQQIVIEQLLFARGPPGNSAVNGIDKIPPFWNGQFR